MLLDCIIYRSIPTCASNGILLDAGSYPCMRCAIGLAVVDSVNLMPEAVSASIPQLVLCGAHKLR